MTAKLRESPREIAWRLCNRIPPVPVFAGETRKEPGDLVISSIGRRSS